MTPNDAVARRFDARYLAIMVGLVRPDQRVAQLSLSEKTLAAFRVFGLVVDQYGRSYVSRQTCA